MAWLILVLSGSLEAVWAAALHRTTQASGRRRIAPAVVFLISVLASTGGLAVAMQSIPTGTAYAVWVGVGVVLTSAYAMITKVEPATRGRILLLGGIVACVAGLKLVV
ncbi:SMR family transporter [Arthrobacter sp. AL08]|uniref:DMT family transporter n=1 Tax=Micrococcaceae TaxID=1268 RepID=UPI001CFFE371|nr:MULTISPECIES: SMR family transporter [Micrococcaceae]MCB5282719.1 Quaternary ammonium compound-resistance protein SugE [Arthrobacter sp. ES1]MDI3240295.1 SMR family transporter [Arthrobacter sp. AL05]MDI3276305.1 SMR family transporter [Arthrobacter sp. AL08]MDJ0353635.1 SMR family transporter [Pseudarthrobacter sp. PH31-O2]WGZ79094.1 SMR family transporter [Arthrobacter sp. EM1]